MAETHPPHQNGSKRPKSARPVRAAARPPTPELLFLDEVATELRISVTTVKRLMKGGELRWLRVAGRERVSRFDLNQYLRNARQQAAQESKEPVDRAKNLERAKNFRRPSAPPPALETGDDDHDPEFADIAGLIDVALGIEEELPDPPETHVAHCCAVHGCKYRAESCPVVLGTLPRAPYGGWCQEPGIIDDPEACRTPKELEPLPGDQDGGALDG